MHEMCQMELAEIKSFTGLVLEYSSLKWDKSEQHAQITGKLMKLFFLALFVSSNTQGKLFFICKASFVSGAIKWKKHLTN